MSSAPLRQPIGEAVHFTAITDPKFKHNRLSVHLTVPLDRSTVTQNALIPQLIYRGFKGCESHTQLARRLGMLYGAMVDVRVSKHGCLQIITLSIQALDDRFALEGEPIVEECARLLRDMLLFPTLGPDGFNPEMTAIEKHNLKDAILAEINDKRSYAIARCHALMDADSPASLRAAGYVEDIDAITPKAAAESYHRLIDSAHIEIMFVGSGNPEPAKACFTEALSGLSRHPHSYVQPDYRRIAPTETQVAEVLDVSQAKLVMGFRAGTAREEDHAPIRMMTALWGGTPSSLLFTTVREKLSLCYYCAARFDRTTGIVMLESGVSSDKAEQAKVAMLDQLERIKAGDFSDMLLENTLRLMQNSLKGLEDTLGGLEGWYLGQILSGRNRTPAEDYAALAAVTRQQVEQAARGVTLDTTYLLKEKEAAAQ